MMMSKMLQTKHEATSQRHVKKKIVTVLNILPTIRVAVCFRISFVCSFIRPDMLPK